MNLSLNYLRNQIASSFLASFINLSIYGLYVRSYPASSSGVGGVDLYAYIVQSIESIALQSLTDGDLSIGSISALFISSRLLLIFFLFFLFKKLYRFFN